MSLFLWSQGQNSVGLKSWTLGIALVVGGAMPAFTFAESPPVESRKTDSQKSEQKAETPAEAAWVSLLDKNSLKGWTKTQFGGEGNIEVKEGVLTLEMGSPLTGVTITEEAFKKLPKINYEMTLEARRVLGGDFFVGLTLPVKSESCSLIMGGWGGGVIGISSLDGYDASENETTTYESFKTNQWYAVRVRVTEEKLQVWLDGGQVIDVEIADKKISTRIEVSLSEPLGLSSFETSAEIRNFKVRPLRKP